MEAFAIADARQRLTEAVDALVGEFIDGCSTHALGDDLVDHPARCRSPRSRVPPSPGPLRSRPRRLADGAGSTASWVRDHCALTWKAGASRVRLARTLGELPASARQRPGRARPLGNVTMIAQLADDVGIEQVAPLEHILVGAAETLDLGDMRTVTQVARLRIDPDGVLADDNHAHERRWFECEQTYGGRVHPPG